MATATYEQFLIEALPGRIEDDQQYDLIRHRFGDLLVKRRRSDSEDRLMRLLGVLIEDYDRRNAMPPIASTPADRLRFLLEPSGRTAADLLPVFGQRSHVNEALNASRTPNLVQARKLRELFGVRPGLFV